MKLLSLLSLFILISCQTETKKEPVAKAEPKAKEGCFCMEVWEPVCGVDNKTYGNTCEADCAKVKVASQGECKK